LTSTILVIAGTTFINFLIRPEAYDDYPVQRDLTWIEKAELMTMLFLHGMALAAWFVPLGAILESANLRSMIPLAFAAAAVAALTSPLFFGAMADRTLPPLKVLRLTSLGSATFAAIVGWQLESGANHRLILLGIQLQSLMSVPTNSLTGSIVFSRLTNSQRQFGSIRALGTLGWMAGCWLVSLLQIDNSPKAFYLSAGLWIVLILFTFVISPGPASSNGSLSKLTLRERFGLDALVLLKNHDHRVIFLTAAFVAVPFAAFYPYTPAHLSDLGLQSISALMSLGQVAEVGVMFLIGGILTNWRLKWVILWGLGFGVARYGLYSFDAPIPLLAGVALHGLAYTFTQISTQIYLAKRIDAAWRTRAQALLSMLTAGVGNLAGYLFTGLWLYLCENKEGINWRLFWGGLSLLVLFVFVYFATSYRGQETESKA